MGHKGVTKVHQGNIFGRMGANLGQSLAEQVPKEVERYRMLKDVNRFEQDYKNLSPMQQLVRAHSIYGSTPQLVQSVTELAKQQGENVDLQNRGARQEQGGTGIESLAGNKIQARGTQDQNQPPMNAPPQGQGQPASPAQPGQPSQTPSITSTEGIAATVNPLMPKTREQILDRAAELQRQSPNLYRNSAQAIKAAEEEDQRAQNENTALQNKRLGEQSVQDRFTSEFNDRLARANINNPKDKETQLPDTLYQKYKNEAIDDINSGKSSESQAADNATAKMVEASKDYAQMRTIGGEGSIFASPKHNMRALRNLRDSFKKRDDLENFVDNLTGINDFSPNKAALIGYDTSDQPALDEALSKVPSIKGSMRGRPSSEDPVKATLKVAPKIAEKMGQDGSILAIAEELNQKGYDPDAWIDYISRNREKYKLSPRQGRELSKKPSWMPYIGDIWNFSMVGRNDLAEEQ